MGVISWCQRKPTLILSHYRGLAEDAGWLLMANNAAHCPQQHQLLSSIAKVLNVNRTDFFEKVDHDFFSDVHFKQLLILGEPLAQQLFAFLGGSQPFGDSVIIGPGLADMIVDPSAKSGLWSQLKPHVYR